MTEFTYDLTRLTQPHKPKIDHALKTAQEGDTIHLLAPLNDAHVHHTYYTVKRRGGGTLVARFDRVVIV